MQLEIIHGPEMYSPDNYACKDPACPVHGRGSLVSRRTEPPSAPKAALNPPPARPAAPADTVPEVRGGFSEVYSTKHEKLLLRVEHIERMDAIRRAFNKGRLHAAKAPLTTCDIVNACLDFVFQHRIAFPALKDAHDLPKFIAEQVYRDALSRWRQWNEAF